MKRFFVIIFSLIIGGAVALAAYPMISPYHARLRADFSNPSKRDAAVQQAIAFEKAHIKALRGDKVEQYRFGLFFSRGDLGFSNATQAFDWFKKSADQGYPLAALAMAHAYLAGEGVQKDEEQGATWAEKAYQSPDVPLARDLMGLLLTGAIGERQDIATGLSLLQRGQSPDVVQVGADIDARLKAVYALPREQRDAELKAMEEAVKAEVRTKFPALEKDIATAGLIDPPATSVAATK
ncbi:MAG: sel1 repeat family protein [Alphaproteobacteria bacterium]|nr:MAG: sel1 repeat family protein [Alphaproteobacteria bacterium]